MQRIFTRLFRNKETLFKNKETSLKNKENIFKNKENIFKKNTILDKIIKQYSHQFYLFNIRK